MRTIKLAVRYDGTSYYGFQKQNNVVTLQGVFEKGLRKIYDSDIKIKYAGRTDKGVHAKFQVISYLDNGKIPITKLYKMLSKHMANAFQIVSVEEVDDDFDPRRHAEYREYEYLLYDGDQNIFLDRYMLYAQNINISAISKSIKQLIGRRDCTPICHNPKQYQNTIIDIFNAEIKADSFKVFNIEGNVYKFTIVASSFLQHMVRKIVGLVLEISQNKLTIDEFCKIIDGKMSYSWPMAPAKALFLSNIVYNIGERK